MRKFVILAALVIAPLVAAGCSCNKYNAYDNQVTTIRYNPNPVCPPAPVPCPPFINNCVPAAAPAPMPMPAPVISQPACPLPNNACGQPVFPYAPLPPAPNFAAQTYAAPAPVQTFAPGRISYMEPVQVSGANQVQYYNPYQVLGNRYY